MLVVSVVVVVASVVVEVSSVGNVVEGSAVVLELVTGAAVVSGAI